MTNINDLNTISVLADDDKFVLWQKQAGATRAITAENMAAYFGAELSDEYQPLDATLTALAGAGFENGRVLLGTGVDTVSNVLPGALPVTATGASEARTLAAWFADEVNPLAFGAVGDGTTNDIVALQAAADAAETLATSRGAIVTIDLAGRAYKLNNTLTLGTGVRLTNGKLISGPASGFTEQTHLPLLYAYQDDDITVEGVDLDISAWTALVGSVASFRAVHFRQGSRISVRNCRITTTGGAVSTVGCTDITIESNDIVCSQPGVEVSGFADGVIDCWVEFDIDAERTVIADNRIKGNTWGRWGIMITGDDFSGQVMDQRSLSITGNVIDDPYYDGIWAFGRDAILTGIAIAGNTIRNARIGISISDATGFSIAGNSVVNTSSHGIHLWSETAAGGTFGASGGAVSGNVLKDLGGIGIYLDNNSSGNVIAANAVVGTSHTFGIAVGASAINNTLAANRLEKGSSAIYSISNTSTRIDGNGYTPTLTNGSNVASSTFRGAQFHVFGDRVIVFFHVEVTPTVGATNTELGISLPFPSNLGTYNLYGSASQATHESAIVTEDATNDRATLRFSPASTASRRISGSFAYLILV